MGRDYHRLVIYGGKGTVHDISSVEEYLDLSDEIEYKIATGQLVQSQVLNFVHTVVIFEKEPASDLVSVDAGYYYTDSPRSSYLSISEKSGNVVVLGQEDYTLLFPFEVEREGSLQDLDSGVFTIFDEAYDGYYLSLETLLKSYDRFLEACDNDKNVFHHHITKFGE